MTSSSHPGKTLLRGGLIVDGTGAPPRPGSVLFDGALIAAIGHVPDGAGTLVECAGKIIAPGSIDAHSPMHFFTASDDPHHFDSFTAPR